MSECEKSLSWLLRVLSQGGVQQKGLLSFLAARQLDGRHLAPGNIVTIGIFGCSVVWQVDNIEGMAFQ